ncbi:Imm1 family immunity protein [Kribbella sp. NPDC058245]|uniref:Imm1 family immunity protein n=1 Tax=Kribbella sp. NPDC058245 TaxID=3346399 RepID=UPI0036F02AD8
MNDQVSAGYFREGRKIATANEMTALLDELQAAGVPVWVELSTRIDDAEAGPYGATVLDVALGNGFGSLTFHEPGADGLRYDSVGTLSDPQDADLDFGGTPQPIETGSAITVQEARTAALEFVATRRRPESVTWKLFDPPPVELEPFTLDDFDEFDPSVARRD